jgi:anti-sigma factor RsiW
MSKRPYLPCREIIAFLADYLDGALALETRSEFDRHLAVCPSCVAYLAGYRDTIRMAKAAARDADAGDPPEELVRAIVASVV